MRVNLNQTWYQSRTNFLSKILFPLSTLFWCGIHLRQLLYRLGIIKTKRFAAPIIVVGNITVGGTGKTPFVIWLAQYLKTQGFSPGIVSRGVGGKKNYQPNYVSIQTNVAEVGDEAVLLVKQTQCPVVVCINRVAAVDYLLKNFSCDVVLSDDGLQHYRLDRNVEIVIVDGIRRFGNQLLLPAGPLREPIKRLKKTDLMIINQGNQHDLCRMEMEPIEFISVKNPQKKIPYAEFPYKQIHAVAAIGHPERFFASLKKMDLNLVTHIFPDHYLFKPQDFAFDSSLPIVMTEKDAIKCQEFADDRYWFLASHVKINAELQKKIHQLMPLLRKQEE